MPKRLAQLGAAVLALLCVATVGAWLRSLHTLDMVTRGEARATASAVHERVWALASHDGRLQLKVQEQQTPATLFGDPARHNRAAWRWHTLPATGRTTFGSFGPTPARRLGFGYATTRHTLRPGQHFSERTIFVPYWALVAALAVPAGLALCPLLRARRARTRALAGHCPACNYDLRGSPAPGSRAACPECGHDERREEVTGSYRELEKGTGEAVAR